MVQDSDDTARLQAQQREREHAEQQLAERAAEAADTGEAAQHERRADKASYLRAKLKEREQSERELEN